MTGDTAGAGLLHHVELWVPDLRAALVSWEWLLGELGYSRFQEWPAGVSFTRGPTYLVLEQSAAMTAPGYDRCRPGLNHLAFWVRSQAEVDRLVEAAPTHAWSLLFPDRHPHAGGPEHYAAYLENDQGFEVELVARDCAGADGSGGSAFGETPDITDGMPTP